MASGLGTTLAAALSYQEMHSPPWKIVALVSSSEVAAANDVAKKHQLPTVIVQSKDFYDFDGWDLAVSAALDEFSPDVVFLMGFLKKIGPQVLKQYRDRIFNSHPSLLPKYGGPGMYGRNVHEAVFKNKEKYSGVSIHKVSENFDEGQILEQRKFELAPLKSVDEIEAAAKTLEKKLVIDYLNRIQDRLKRS